jgi:manganese/zinc/iron transport system substrate-binding protein
MRYLTQIIMAVLVLMSLLIGTQTAWCESLNILTTTGMIADITANIGGDLVKVTAMMGPGVDPHLYQATARDVQRMRKADIILYNGLHLEAGIQKILERMQNKAYAVTDAISADIIETANDKMDPHVWMDVSLWMQAVESITDILAQKAPDHAETFRAQSRLYLQELKALHDSIQSQIQMIPESQRVLISAHDAFTYFGKVYGMEVKALMGISTQTEAGTKDVQDLANFIAARKIKAVFIESSVPEKYIQAVQKAVNEKGFNVVIGGELFSDAMGDEGTPEGTYIGMIKHNTETIVNALK